MNKEMQKFWISQPAVWIKDDKCLILESVKRPGFWGLPGGRIDEGEDAKTAFARELKEELNINEFKNLGIVDYLVLYNNSSGDKLTAPICAIISLISSNEDVKNNDLTEHSSFKWITRNQIQDYQYVWPNLGTVLSKAFDLCNKIK
jgi:8-oxo-dGTP diphosphatase